MSTMLVARALLDAVAIRSASFHEARHRYAAQLAPDFHLFDYLRNDEMGLSRYLALLLDVRGAHGQGDLFLRSFLDLLGVSASWANPEELVSITLEKQANGMRRIDIYLVFKNGVLAIENKPWAGDQADQLKDYAEFLAGSHSGRHWLLVYLCNDDPSEASITKEALFALESARNYVRLDFYQLAAWLENSACYSRAPNVRLFSESLAGFVRRNINGELEVTESEELKNLILERDEYIESAFRVSAAVHRVREDLLTMLAADLCEALEDHGMALVWDDEKLRRGQKYAGFGVQFNEQHNVHLRFEFGESGLNSLEWGLCRNHAKIALDGEKAERLNAAMQKVFGAGTLGQYWPWYLERTAQVHDAVLSAEERNWSGHAEPWQLIRDKTENGFVARIVKLALQVKAALADVDDAMR